MPVSLPPGSCRTKGGSLIQHEQAQTLALPDQAGRPDGLTGRAADKAAGRVSGTAIGNRPRAATNRARRRSHERSLPAPDRATYGCGVDTAPRSDDTANCSNNTGWRSIALSLSHMMMAGRYCPGSDLPAGTTPDMLAQFPCAVIARAVPIRPPQRHRLLQVPVRKDEATPGAPGSFARRPATG